MGKGDVCPFFSNCQLATSICKEKEAVDKMIAHFVTAPFIMLALFRIPLAHPPVTLVLLFVLRSRKVIRSAQR